jgi:hypothetical protein
MWNTTQAGRELAAILRLKQGEPTSAGRRLRKVGTRCLPILYRQICRMGPPEVPLEPSEPIETIAKRYLGAGLSVIPVTRGKKPSISSWKPYQSQRATPEEVDQWSESPRTLGYAIVCGKVSGNLEVIDIDDTAAKEQFLQGLDDDPVLKSRLVMVDTPKGGLHIYYRCDQIEGNQKLARDEQDGQSRILIETRGDGGYVIAPGSDPRVHPLNKPYLLRQGEFGKVPELTTGERDALRGLARSLNRVVSDSNVDKQLAGEQQGL